MNIEVWRSGSESPSGAEGPGSQSWASREGPKSKNEFDNEPEYKKQLYRLFSPRVAESFLQPQLARPLVNPWIQQVLEGMGGQVTAEDLWRTIREDSRRQWSLAYPQLPQGAGQGKWNGTRVVKHPWPGVSRIRGAVEVQQEQASAMLSANPLHDLNDSAGQEGPGRFLAPGIITIPTGRHGNNSEEFQAAPKCEKGTRTSTPRGMQWDGKNYRFLVDSDISTVQPSAWWRPLKRRDVRNSNQTGRHNFQLTASTQEAPRHKQPQFKSIPLKTIGVGP
ncbi:uncharacterized protein LOC119973652 [Scyliorhinus canicula]|uniref:uncharacterized protein LOC119973652 n=1 Tax=Scyliorhinus canicula TaxID=7830 RepID=UPI0018F6DB72|nr:uncharacterized protein LOC119973652 [Scyliorhinus canicula]